MERVRHREPGGGYCRGVAFGVWYALARVGERREPRLIEYGDERTTEDLVLGVPQDRDDTGGDDMTTETHCAVRYERDQYRTLARTLRAALAEVIAEDDRHRPCDHEPDPTGANGCTHCYGRHLVAITEEDV